MREKKLTQQYRSAAKAALGGLAVVGMLAIALVGCSNPLAKEAQAIRAEASSPILTLSLSDNSALNSGAKIDFGMVSVGSICDIEFTIKNTGTNELVIDVAGMLVTPNSATETGSFSVSVVPSTKIAPNEASSFKIRFTPVSDGTKTASITIPTNDVRTPSFSLTIEGKGWPLALTTNSVTTIAQTTGTGGGNITNDGGIPVTERGICWGTSPNPTIADSKASDGGLGTGSYSCLMTPLTPGALYYVRAYASNGIITGYGSQVSFTTLPATPAAPTVAAVGYPSGSGQLTVSWAAVNGASIYYDVYYNTSNTLSGSSNGPTDLTTTSCTLSGLVDYSNYYVWIKAKNATGSSTSNSSSPTMVGVKVASISLSKTSATFLPGSSETIIATISPANATKPDIGWAVTAGATYASVTNGTINGIAAGSSTITATAADLQGAPAVAFNATTINYVAGAAGPAGGKLFYDSLSYGSKGWRYMEAATSNIGAGHMWDRGGIYRRIISGTDTAIGTGKENTDAIIADQGIGTYMASDCRSYAGGAYSDWFMPSKDEVIEILKVSGLIDLPTLAASYSGIDSSSQGTSSPTIACSAYRYSESTSTWGWAEVYKSWVNYYTRPVRRF